MISRSCWNWSQSVFHLSLSQSVLDFTSLYMTLSSVNSQHFQVTWCGMVLKARKRIGPSTPPCGKLDVTAASSVQSLSTTLSIWGGWSPLCHRSWLVSLPFCSYIIIVSAFGCTAALVTTSTNIMMWSITAVSYGSVVTLFTSVGFIHRNLSRVLSFRIGNHLCQELDSVRPKSD